MSDNTLTFATEDAQTGLALAALIASGDLQGAQQLHDDPVAIAAVYAIGQALDGYVDAITHGQAAIAWPLVAEAIRTQLNGLNSQEPGI